jgi:hypothetical protein
MPAHAPDRKAQPEHGLTGLAATGMTCGNVGPVGLEPTTYGLKVAHPLCRGVPVDAGWAAFAGHPRRSGALSSLLWRAFWPGIAWAGVTGWGRGSRFERSSTA